MDGDASSKQLSDMLQKFALAFKSKTYELFAEDDSDCDATRLLDSAEEFIPDQKVVVIKPDSECGRGSVHARLIGVLLPSIFAMLASLEALYLQFQGAHVPEVDQDALESVDRLIVSILQKLTEMKNLYKDSEKRNVVDSFGEFDFPANSFLEYQVQENQSKLRILEMTVNSLQSQIDFKAGEVRNLRKKFDEIRNSNAKLVQKLDEDMNFRMDILLSIRVFEAMLCDSVKSLRHFTKLLIELMRGAGWDLTEAASYIYSGVAYSKKGHFRFAFLSYVCMGMCQDFDHGDFGVSDKEAIPNESFENSGNYLKQLVEHLAGNPMEILSRNPDSPFSRFCSIKYEKLVHPTMESSMFSHLDRKGKVLESWRSLPVFYESFVRMASSIWLLHKLAYSFSPPVEIFQVSTGTEFSAVYMEDVLRMSATGNKTGHRVGFSVVPGFKVGKTIVQSQVYISEMKGR